MTEFIRESNRASARFRSSKAGRFTAPPLTIRRLSLGEQRSLPVADAVYFTFRRVPGGIICGYGPTPEDAAADTWY